MIKNTERIILKENIKTNNSVNDSFSSINSFYNQLDNDSKKDIFFLIESGFNKKQIIKLYILMKPSNVNEAMSYLSKENGKYQHPFFPSKKSNEICEICKSDKNLHLAQINKLPSIRSNNSSISSMKFNHSNIITITVSSKEAYECKICFDIIQKEEALKNKCYNCNKYFCDGCLYSDLKESIKNGKYELYCPECKIIYDEEKILYILSNYSEEGENENEEEKKELIDLYKKNKFKHTILSNNHLMFCPIPDCEGYAAKNNSSNFNTCNKGHKFCVRCGEIWHSTGICPEEKKLDELFQYYYERLKLKKCPFCQVMTMKRGGCNHIKCTYCKRHWCWICGELFESVDQHYGNTNSKCYQKMNMNIIENDICSKCENVNNKFWIFDNCHHRICYNCLEQYFLENEITIDNYIYLKCISEGCNNNDRLKVREFVNLIDHINNKLLKKKYNKEYYFNKFNSTNISDFFFFRRIVDYNDICFEINEFIFCIRPWRNCWRNIPCVIEALYIIWLIIFQVIAFYLMPISLQICIRNLYYAFAKLIVFEYYNKFLIIPLIIGEEVLTLVYFVPLSVLHYFY